MASKEVKEEDIEKPKWVQERFPLESRGFFGDEIQIVDDSIFDELPTQKKLAPRLRKYWAKGKDNWGDSSYKIKNYERWLQIKEMLETQIFPKINWTKFGEISEELKNEKQAKIEINKKIQKLILQNPSLANDVLSKLDLMSLGKEDIPFVLELGSNLDKKLLEADASIKSTFKSIINNLSKSGKKGLNQLSELLDDWKLLDLTSISSILCKRISTLELLENMITKEETYEIKGDNSIHRILERNMWVLDENYWLMHSNKSLRTFIGDSIMKKHKKESKKRPDFVCSTWENKLLIVEIKKPSLTLGKKEIDQIEEYTMIAEDYKSKDFKNVIAKLIGNKISPEGKKLINKRTGIEFLTYNDLISKVKQRYIQYLKKLEEVKGEE